MFFRSVFGLITSYVARLAANLLVWPSLHASPHMMAAPAFQDELRLVLLPRQRHPKLAAGGRLYTKHFVYNDRIIWCCDTRRNTKCAGSLVVAGDGPFMDVLSSTPHSCRLPSDAGEGLRS